jgi:hypothetical protein
MSQIRYLLDEHIPRAVAEALRRRDIDVVRATDAGLRRGRDERYLRYARETGRVLVIQDRDFLRLQAANEHLGIVISPAGPHNVRGLIEWLCLIHDLMDPAEMVNTVQYL